ncbi:MAG: CooT family nickel-binding protein [Nitrososphaerales archaeon]
MCEFKVLLKTEAQEETVAEDIVYAKTGHGSVVLRGVLGNQETINGVDILEIDVNAERLVLIPHIHHHD